MQESMENHKKNSRSRTESNLKHKLALQHQQEDFLAVLNHRLRTPILASHRIIQLLLEGQFGELDSKQKELIALLDESMAEVDRLTLMVMDICRYRSGSKSLNFEYVKVSDLVASVLKKREKKGIDVSTNVVPADVEIYCDKSETLRMLNHIVDNAFKHARSQLSLRVMRNKVNECVISIEDDGKGLPVDDINDLFERFFVVSSNGHYAPVTGAGLCLCNEIIKAHNGKISCFSSADKGTCFEIRLPTIFAQD